MRLPITVNSNVCFRTHNLDRQAIDRIKRLLTYGYPSDLVSDPPAQLSTPSRGAEPSSESAASLMLDLLHGTVFHTISIISVTLVFSSAASKLNYFVEHTSLVVSASGRSVNSAIEMTVLLLLLLLTYLAWGETSWDETSRGRTDEGAKHP